MSETNGEETNPVERHVIHDYILGLKEPITVADMKPLIGERFPVLQEGYERGKKIADTDHLKITSVKFPIDVATGLSDGVVMIYSDYYLDGRIKYNAWTGLKSLQDYINTYLGV